MDSAELITKINEIRPKSGKATLIKAKALLEVASSTVQEYEDKIDKYQIEISTLQARERNINLQLSYIKEAVVNAEALSKDIELEARDNAEKIRNEATEEGNRIIAKAREDAEGILAQARLDAETENAQLLQETADFRNVLEETKRQYEELQSKIKTFVEIKRTEE